VIIDCDTCQVRGLACGDCVVSVLLGTPEMRRPVDLDDAEARAISVLAVSGLVPPLRLAPCESTAETGPAGHTPTYHGPHGPGSARAG
jgi:hypothetical protein